MGSNGEGGAYIKNVHCWYMWVVGDCCGRLRTSYDIGAQEMNEWICSRVLGSFLGCAFSRYNYLYLSKK